MGRIVALLVISLSTGCGGAADDLLENSVDLTVENRSGAEIWYFQYSGCGEDLWTEVIADDEYVANGDDVTAYLLDPGCYDLYVEDEFGCFSGNSTDGNLEGGLVFTWTVTQGDFTCF
jgi:hypothetical protein